MMNYESWGRFPKADQAVEPLFWTTDPLPKTGLKLLPRGYGRSYGDCCLNDGESLIDVCGLNRFLDFNSTAGTLRCEAGASFADILEFIVPRKFFLPVSPGTKFVSVGGAIANDIHGKNHHRAGTFGRHVFQFELLRSDGQKLICSRLQNPELFSATIGGLGLTGIILWAELDLKPIATRFINVETIKFSDTAEFLSLCRDSESSWEHTVAWVDVSGGKKTGRGHFMRGNHAGSEAPSGPASHTSRHVGVFCDAPEFLLNNFTFRTFNTLYYHKQFSRCSHATVDYDPFFYPLDGLDHWNRLYGRRGFLQHQCVLCDEGPRTMGPDTGGGTFPLPAADRLAEILDVVAHSGHASALAVAKTFGSLESPGMLSFPRKGVTLTLDFPNSGRSLFDLLDRINDIVMAGGGAIYPAKDAQMSPECFRRSFPRWREFEKHIDPQFSSSFWRRVASAE